MKLGQVISTNLLETVLVQPVREGADSLLVASGYASPIMVLDHYEELAKHELGKKLRRIDLVVGMTGGVKEKDHKVFKRLVNDYSKGFSCRYLLTKPQFHSKAYLWLRAGKPFKSFVGSANYSRNAFHERQRELLALADPFEVMSYFEQLKEDTRDCNDPHIDQVIRIKEDTQFTQAENSSKHISFEVPLFSSTTGKIQGPGAGLNWGMPKGNRKRSNPNEAYIQLRPEVYKSGFFPVRGNHFTVKTDDGKEFVMGRVSKSAEGQQLQTPICNADLGVYFRNRLDIPLGQLITDKDLERYGRNSVIFTKKADLEFEMNFSKLK